MIRRFRAGAGGLVLDPGAELSECLWIDLDRPQLATLVEIEAALGVSLPASDQVRRLETSDRFYRRGSATYLHITLLETGAGPVPVVAPMVMALTPTTIITLRRAGSGDPFEGGLEGILADPTAATREGLLAELLEVLIERMAAQIATVESDIEAIAARVFDEDPRRASGRMFEQARIYRHLLRRIGRRDHATARLRVCLVDFSRALGFLAGLDETRVSQSCRQRLSILTGDVRDLIELTLGMSQQTGFLQAATLGQINLDQNIVIKLFTIVSVLFLPPTLIGTVYGMNFSQMPELGWAYGYPLALAAMVVSAMVPLVWMRRRGWF